MKEQESKLSQVKNIPSNVAGTILVLLGVAFPILWILDYIGIIRPGSPDPIVWPILLMCSGSLGFGWLLINNEGRTIADVFISWFSKRSGE